ncbi:MAG TPA: hypothetical protein VFQ86_00775, partial [Arachidicoccus soli]|nr:hypothetical protein [Arachidicoccus soli]
IGDRKRYFRSNIESWKNLFSEQFSKLIYLNELLKEISEVRTTDTKEFNTALNQLIDFMTYFLQEIPKIFEKWEEKN